ncbi:hypothetical protein [Caloranaerobacter sp. DY30410]|uniref:hypothetical protein n=1 Tax=Caloranaerobacter sp. DY30410 TaxID=3238305 RepID=UPI003CFFAC09
MNKKSLIFIFICLVIGISTFLLANYTNLSNNRKIEYEILFNGFILIDDKKEPLPPTETLVFTSQNEWIKFSNKYFPQVNSIISMFNTVDFTKESIVYNLTISPKIQYGLSDELDGFILVDNKLITKYKHTPNRHGVYALNRNNLIHPFLIIAKIDNKYISDNIRNIYISN